MRRKVTKLTRERAFASIKVVAKAVTEGELFISYSDLAKRIGMRNETGQGLGPILNEAAEMCLENFLPDISAIVVTKSSIEDGNPMPSTDSFVNGVWPVNGLSLEEVPNEQKRVRAFDWKQVKSLGIW